MRKRVIWSHRGRGARRNARCFFLLIAPLHLPQAARCSEPWHAPRPIFKAFYPNKKWNRSLRSRWNNLLCKLWYLTLRVKWNEINPSPPQRFHAPQAYFTPAGHFTNPEGIYFVEKSTCKCKCFFPGSPCWTRTNDPAVNSGCDANIKQYHSIPCSVEPWFYLYNAIDKRFAWCEKSLNNNGVRQLLDGLLAVVLYSGVEQLIAH